MFLSQRMEKYPHQDRVEVAKSLFGILPKDADLNEAKEERLGAK